MRRRGPMGGGGIRGSISRPRRYIAISTARSSEGDVEIQKSPGAVRGGRDHPAADAGSSGALIPPHLVSPPPEGYRFTPPPVCLGLRPSLCVFRTLDPPRLRVKDRAIEVVEFS